MVDFKFHPRYVIAILFKHFLSQVLEEKDTQENEEK
jgi:hypothetical protein